MNTIQVHMKFFGAFRQYGDDCSFTVPAGSNAETIKSVLAKENENIDPKLIKAAALANQNTILTTADELDADCELSILPPVCGG